MYKSVRTRAPSYCKGCGKEIRWVRGKGAGASAVPVEPRKCYYIPSANGTAFIMPNGKVNYGSPAQEGILGYTEHVCEMFMRKVLTDQEITQRCWA